VKPGNTRGKGDFKQSSRRKKRGRATTLWGKRGKQVRRRREGLGKEKSTITARWSQGKQGEGQTDIATLGSKRGERLPGGKGFGGDCPAVNLEHLERVGTCIPAQKKKQEKKHNKYNRGSRKDPRKARNKNNENAKNYKGGGKKGRGGQKLTCHELDRRDRCGLKKTDDSNDFTRQIYC